jgi:hypothetical protein
MLVRNLLLVELRRHIRRGLDGLLHFLRELVDAHPATYGTLSASQSGASFYAADHINTE